MTHNGRSQPYYQYCPGGGTSFPSSKLLGKFQGSLVNPARHFLIGVRWGEKQKREDWKKRREGGREGRHEHVNALAVYIS